MKLVCQRSAFTSAFSTVASCVPARPIKDVLKCVLLTARKGLVELSSTDTETSIRNTVSGVAATGEGSILLPAGRVGSILSELKSDDFELNVEDDLVVLSAGNAVFEIPLGDAAEFPPVGEFIGSNYFSMSPLHLRQMIRRTALAVSNEGGRFSLNGQLIKIEREEISIVSTDSRRLALTVSKCESVGSPEFPDSKIIVPGKAMSLIDRSLDIGASRVDLAFAENGITVRSGASVIHSRLLAGSFPRYENVIPPRFNHSINLEPASIHSAIRQSLIMSDDLTSAVDFKFTEDEGLRLVGESSNAGSSRIIVPVQFQGEPFTVRLNARYISDYLKVIPAEASVLMCAINPDAAVVLKSDDSFVYVVMPLSSGD